LKRITIKEKILEFLKENPEPSSAEIIRLAGKLKCSDRWVWKVKAQLIESTKKASEEFILIDQLSSGAFFLYSLFDDFSNNGFRELKIEEAKKIVGIEQLLESMGYEIIE
jgi:hypothetical protein